VGQFGFHRLIQRVGEAAKMPFPIHPHMLRHACGFKLANDGHDTRALQHYLGHKNIQHGALHRNGAGSLQEFLALTGGGKLGIASPSISFALWAPGSLTMP
jgi:integrase